MAQIGAVIEGKYEVLKQIGKGGMSKVYLAMDQNLNKQWAIKEVEKRPGDKHNADVVKTAMTEANMMKKLDHPFLPRIVDILDKENVVYVVMDYVEGEPLSSVLAKYGAQPQEEVLKWAKDLCLVLDYLHTRKPPIIYRDMKPANIMLQPNGNIKLIDFGIAKEYKEDEIADAHRMGTRGYAAPEQFDGKTDARTDVYCLGATLYHLLTGKNPCDSMDGSNSGKSRGKGFSDGLENIIQNYPIRYWNPQLSSGLESIIQKCTMLNPEDRYQSCAELLYALENYDKMDETYRRKQKNKLKLFAALAVCAVMNLAAGGICQGMKVYANNNDYEKTIDEAQRASTDIEKIACYIRAIDILPGDSEAYRGLIDAFKDDAVFTVEEEEQFKKKINSNLSLLEDNEDFGELAFEIGKLYWYYYDYGRENGSDNQITRMKSAIQWFEMACQYGGENSSYYATAATYRDIGQFNRDVTLNVEEASDMGTYLPYWDNISSLINNMTEDQDESEIVDLEIYKLGTNAIESYARKFKADGVEREEMDALFLKIKEGVGNLETSTDKTDQMKQEINSRIFAAETAIENAYAENKNIAVQGMEEDDS